MMIFKKAIPRRTFLTGMGATLALPLLDAMVPAFASVRDNTAVKSPVRLGIVYVPCGVIPEKWRPATEGTAFEMTPILEPLTAFRNNMVVLSELTQVQGRRLAADPGGDHARAGGTFLTGVHPKQTEGTGSPQAGVSFDQIAAKELGKHTPLASLEISLETSELLGACDQGWSCAYTNTLSWRTPTTPMPMEYNPRAVFQRMFGEGNVADAAARRAQVQEDRSILDAMTGEVTRFLKLLGPSDRLKLTEYLDATRDVERRIQVAEERTDRELPSLQPPTDVPGTYEERAKIMFDLQVLAYQCDLTRVITFMMAREGSYRYYPEIGVHDGHHPLTHHRGDREKIAKVIKINIFHTKLFAYYLEKLRSTPDGDGSLLDHSVILYGSGLGDGNTHSFENLPILLLGSAGGQIQGGRHIVYQREKETKLTNLFLTLLDMVGAPIDHLGDSQGKLELLPV
jgi:uncharacterized protein DUF1552